MIESAPPKSKIRQIRLLLWLLVALAAGGTAALLLIDRVPVKPPEAVTGSTTRFGGPFTLVGGDGKPFPSSRLAGKPYAIYFGFTRCGDVCPTTLSRLVKLRQQAGGEQTFNIVFVTIDPKNDGPREVGQYAELFNSPIVGLTGSDGQIAEVKKQYGIYAEPSPHPMPGKEMMHTATVLLFDARGNFEGTISPSDPDQVALAKLKQLTA